MHLALGTSTRSLFCTFVASSPALAPASSSPSPATRDGKSVVVVLYFA
jgi:hypothetical protein